MVAVLTAALMSAAEISNFLSALGVVLCFLSMVVFILRLTGDDLLGTSVVHVAQPPVAQVSMQKISVPFSLSLHQSREATHHDIQLKIKSDVSYKLRSFWGIPSDQLHYLLGAPWTAFLAHFVQEPSINAQVIEQLISEDSTSGEEKVKKLGLSEDICLQLGTPPRKTYPLVVCITRHEDSQQFDSTEVGALVSVIHIKDEGCLVPTCILHQYLKQVSGQTTRLQLQFKDAAAQFEADQNKHRQRTEDESETEEVALEEACVKANKITRALLPCRHVCICRSCSKHMDTCPMCRTRITSYFLVAEESSDDEEEELHNTATQPQTLLQRLNNTLNDLMGLAT
ncbi:unnamed protein product, partial [Meganyctiphanes norvegica]